ncbi:MAG: MoxR family ATPase [Clostridiales Family XIII bacterium]|nr:MoxR family ATPase [Clostridiales Family XIII bacterium]
MERIRQIAEAAVAEASKAIIGKEWQIRLVLAAIFCGGHVLLDDLPGVGKTTLVKVVSRVLGCSFSRVQFTPDLLPSDITGMSVFDQKLGDFRTMRGPVMANIFLADEINRAIPRTQAALLEAMEELQVTIDGEAYALPEPFIVMATQNPVEMESTFHLPIAQMDRFLMRLSLGYPSRGEEAEMLRAVGDGTRLDSLAAVTCADALGGLRREIAESVYIDDKVLDYIVSITGATRDSGLLALPAGPRASRALYRAGKAFAAMNGRAFVTPDDVKALAPYILPHRVTPNGEARAMGKSADGIIGDILGTVAAPGGEGGMLYAR